MRINTAELVATVTRAAMGQGTDADAKERLKRRVLAACGQATPCTDWVAGSLANLVVYHGVPVEDFNRLLGDLDAMRSAGSLRHAGKFVHAKARELALRLGKPWPRHAVAVG